MNMKSLIAKHFALMIAFSFLSFAAFSASPETEEIAQRVKNLNTVIEVKTTPKVIHEALMRVSRYRNDSEMILGKTSLYFPMIEFQLRERNMPDEIKYLAVIESGLNPTLESRKGAAGMWQIMERTAGILGLKVDKYVDERKDTEKSTAAALDYLLLLYNMYDDWTMALAAYNCGEGNVNKAIRKSGGKTSYWGIHPYLPRETQNFIPRFLGVAYLMNYYYLHDLTPREPSDDFRYPLTIKVFDKVDLKTLAEDLGTDMEIIKLLNPMYRRGIIPQPSGDNFYTLTLPDLVMAKYVENHNSVDNIISKPFVLTRNRWKDVEAYAGASESTIHYLNRLEWAPVRTRIDDNVAKIIEEKLKINTGPVTLYRLGRKESLSQVAEKYNVSLEDLMSVNNVTSGQIIFPGSIIVLPTPKA